MKRNVTFGPLPGQDGANDDGGDQERLPLLGGLASGRNNHTYQGYLKAKIWDLSRRGLEFASSDTGRGVFKCSIAYLLGSFATFIPQIAALLGEQGGKHMVATITVYFHPARSIGSMFEAMICATGAFLYAVFICFSSMGVSILFGDTLDNIILGHVVVLIIFCGGGLGFVGWIKQRLSNPLVNISCSLTSLAIITVLTKEGAVQAAEFSDDKVNQVMFMIIMGVLATTAVSFLIWPVSARTSLRNDLVKVSDLLRDSLTIITRGFLSGSEDDIKQEALKEATDRSKKLHTSLTKNLREAKYEHYVLGTERQYKIELKLVNCMQRLSQNIGGLRSAATTQFLLLAEPSDGDSVEVPASSRSDQFSDSYFTSLESPDPASNIRDILASPDRLTGANLPEHLKAVQTNSQSSTSSAEDIFSTFIIQLGPSMVRMIFLITGNSADRVFRNHWPLLSKKSLTNFHSVRTVVLLLMPILKPVLQMQSNYTQALAKKP